MTAFLTEQIPQMPHAETYESALYANVKAPNPVWLELVYLLLKIAAIVGVFILLFTFLFGLVRYPDPSMAPAIKEGDLVVFYRYSKDAYLPRDVVILSVDGEKQARRIIGVSGDTVDITEDGVRINGALQQELHIYQKTERYTDGPNFPLTVAPGEVFVLADSRTGATDSRIYGPIKLEDTLGKVMTVIRRRGI
jgi:signal peptidase I